jgi:hypothetical protein
MRGNPPLSGGRTLVDETTYDIYFERIEPPPSWTDEEEEGDGSDPSGNTPAENFPPDVTQDSTFYISRTDRDGEVPRSGALAVYGRNANFDIMAGKPQDYNTSLSFYVGPDLLPNANFWYESFSKFDQFNLKGTPSGTICGLPEEFIFVKTRDNRFGKYTDSATELALIDLKRLATGEKRGTISDSATCCQRLIQHIKD